MRGDPYASWSDHDYAIERPRRSEQPQFESAEGLARAVIVFLWIVVSLYLIDIPLILARVLSSSEWAGSMGVYLMHQFILLLVTMLTGTWFIAWMFRCHRNLKFLRARSIECTSASAIWAWFVPLLNLYGPYQVMQEIWRGSDPKSASAKGLSLKIKQDNSMLVRCWWGLWVTTLFLDLDKLLPLAWVADQFRFMRKVELPDIVVTVLQEAAPLFTGGQIACWFLSPACAILAIVMVGRITENQERRMVMIERDQRAAFAQAKLEDPEELEVIPQPPPKNFPDE